MKDSITNIQRTIYDNPKRWGMIYHDVNFFRAKLTLQAIPKEVNKILDLGSGDGLVFNVLKNDLYKAFAYDISYSALRKIESANLILGTASQLPFTSNTFDLIIACELLEHIPSIQLSYVLKEIERVSKKYILITVPYKEKPEINFARCPSCGCIFNGAYHVRSFNSNDVKFLFKDYKCIKIDKIVDVLNPDRTLSLELFIRQHLAKEYLYIGPSVKCPLCLSPVDTKPDRNWIGWIATGMRYLYRIFDRSMSPMWYLAVYKKS
jgi:hypothetical protein